MADLKRDRVNRVPGLVYLPIDGSRFHRGQRIRVTNIEEKDIDPDVRDSMDMEEPLDGNSIGDAVFDAMQDVEVIPEVIGDNSQSDHKTVLGFSSGNFCILLDTGGSSYSGGEVVNECDAGLVNDEG